jgi:hypothetical protein
MTTIPYYTPLPEFHDDDILSATRLNQMLTNMDAVYGLDQKMSIGTTYGWNSTVDGENNTWWRGWVAFHGNQLKIYVQEPCVVKFDVTEKYQLHTTTFQPSGFTAGLKTINLPAGYTEWDCYCIEIQNQLPPLYAYMTDSSAASIGSMPTFPEDDTSSDAHLNAIIRATGTLAEQFNQPIAAGSRWSSNVANDPSWLNDQYDHSIEFYIQHRHTRFQFYVTAEASSGNGTLDTIAWHVYTGGGWHLLWSEDVPRLGFGTLPAFLEGPVDIALPTWIFTVGNWYRMRFSHSLNGDTQAHRDGVCRLYYYGEQRSNTASLWTAQTRWDAGDVVHGDADGPPQLDTMSANLEWLDTRRNTTNPVMRQSRQLRDESPETRTETVFTRRIHRWLAYENATEEDTPTLYYTTDRLNVFASVTMPVSYTTVYLDLDTTPVKAGMVFYVSNCHYAIQVPDHP